VATAKSHGEDLVLLCGSGIEEAAFVVRTGVELSEVRSVAVPQEGGMKDLTAAALLRTLPSKPETTLRFPSGDGAILAFVGQAVDAASMVEPYATMLEVLGLGRVVRRTGDVWKGAPGCSLATSRRTIEERPELVRAVVEADVRGASAVLAHPGASARVAAPIIGVKAEIVERAFGVNAPDITALENTDAMDRILELMQDLGYVDSKPRDFSDLSFLRDVRKSLGV
jgi:ABC-type nitrate/sulfonate/bicarbonate transport system substrate-binding protein